MKKSNLWTGAGMTIAGALFFLAALLGDTPLGSLFCGLSSALTVSGVMQTWKYIKWTRLETADSYQRYQEEQQIDLRDERKNMLRDKSGRYAFLLGLVVTAAATVIFFVLGELGAIGEEAERLITIFLGGYTLVLYCAWLVIYRLLEKKY